ncbi:MAG: hypothetical protein VCD00_01665 [Candidatus Hydrogenedentota bacterium]
MGLTIGQGPSFLAGPRSVRRAPSVSLLGSDSDRGLRLLGQKDKSDKPSLFRKSDDSRSSVLLSGPGAALSTISRTVAGVRELIPTIREVQIGFQRKAAEDRESSGIGALAGRRDEKSSNAFATSSGKGELSNRLEFRLPNPSANALNFVNALNDSARDVQARLSGEHPEPKAGGSFQVNGQTFPFNTDSGTFLNLTV